MTIDILTALGGLLGAMVPIILILWRINTNIKEEIRKQVTESSAELSNKIDSVIMTQREIRIDHKEVMSEVHSSKDQLKDQITKFHYEMTRGYDDLKHRIGKDRE